MSASGPDLHLLASYPVDGDGEQCTRESPADCGVPLDSELELRFDRFVDPSTIVRQSLSAYSGTEDAWIFLIPHYDVVERVVRFEPSGGVWPAGLRITVELLAPEVRGDPGFAAFDGAPLSPGPVPLHLSFRTRTTAPEFPETPNESLCQRHERLLGDVEDVIERAGCASTPCHQPTGSASCAGGEARIVNSDSCVGVPRMGLDLSSSAGWSETAIGQVAHQTETGPARNVALEAPDRFGVAMPIIDPGRPANSFLMYKLLKSELTWRQVPCTSIHKVALAGACPRPEDAELGRLADWFVSGAAMPLGEVALDRAGLDQIQAWIAAGAPVAGCAPD